MAVPFTEDAVRLKLDGVEVPIVGDYDVDTGIIEVPTKFSLTIGHGGLFLDLAVRFPPRTKFEIFIGQTLVSTGETDGFDLAGSDATQMKITGRGYLARLAKTQILDERTFGEKTFVDLFMVALEECGLGDRTVFSTNAANRKAITGSKFDTDLDKKTENVVTEVGNTADGSKVIYNTIKAEIGSTWWEMLTTQNRRAGLFAWETFNGDMVLTRPNGNQSPTYALVRRRGMAVNAVNIVGQPSFKHDTNTRYSECLVVGRGGGGKNGRTKAEGRYIDEEMVAILNPDPAKRADGGERKERLIVKDQHVRTPEQAKLLARRKIAECRRNSWQLSYTVAGHTTNALRGGGRVIWQPDTVVHVTDDELGIEGPMYLESVKFQRKPETQTVLKLMRCEDLIYAEETDEQFNKKPKLVKKPGVALFREIVKSVQYGNKTIIWQKTPEGSVEPTVRTDISTPKVFR